MNSRQINKQIKSLIKERDYTDKSNFETREYLNNKIEKLMSKYELQLNKEVGIK